MEKNKDSSKDWPHVSIEILTKEGECRYISLYPLLKQLTSSPAILSTLERDCTTQDGKKKLPDEVIVLHSLDAKAMVDEFDKISKKYIQNGTLQWSLLKGSSIFWSEGNLNCAGICFYLLRAGVTGNKNDRIAFELKTPETVKALDFWWNTVGPISALTLIFPPIAPIVGIVVGTITAVTAWNIPDNIRKDGVIGPEFVGSIANKISYHEQDQGLNKIKRP